MDGWFVKLNTDLYGCVKCKAIKEAFVPMWDKTKMLR